MATSQKPAQPATATKPSAAVREADLIEVMDAMSDYRAAKWIKRALLQVAFKHPAAVLDALRSVDELIEKEKANKASS